MRSEWYITSQMTQQTIIFKLRLKTQSEQYITHCIPGVGIHKEWCGNIQGMEQNETGLLQDSWEQKEWTRNPPGVQE